MTSPTNEETITRKEVKDWEEVKCQYEEFYNQEEYIKLKKRDKSERDFFRGKKR